MSVRCTWLIASGCVLTLACGGGAPEPSETSSLPVAPSEPVSLDRNDYPVFPDADAGADPAVSAEDGGAGFTGEGWQTNTDFDFIGDPRALKGGTLRHHEIDFPSTLRILGPNKIYWNQVVEGMVYEPLLGLHPTTLEFVPALATHWQISDDMMTFRYRINPNARYSDGRPVVAEDVVATWEFVMDSGLQDPMTTLSYEKFERPVAESKYIVSVRSKTLNWRNFLYFSASLSILPSHVLREVDGETYIRDFNFQMLPGTGPYSIAEDDVDKGKSITIRRRTDYWATHHRQHVGVSNFDEIRSVVVRDQNLAFEMFKRGDLDYFYVLRSRRWVEELDFDRVQRGMIQKRKIFNNKPNGMAGIAMNTRRPPFDDIRVRRALAHLYNREQLIEKLFYGEYLPQNSYYAGGVYENPDNPQNLYDPEGALQLLAEAGWDTRDTQGRLVKNGEPLTVELLYYDQEQETYLTVFQEDLRRAGIALNLRRVTFATLVKLLDERNFDASTVGYSGLTFPNPETSFHSSLADLDNTNNITGIKNARIDEICEAYDEMFDIGERVEAIREIDGILANDHLFLLSWYIPAERLAYWNKFGQPAGALTRTGTFRALMSVWWIDPERSQQLDQAMRDESVTFEVGPPEDRYWLEYDDASSHAPSTTSP